MSNDLNRVTLIGSLGMDPELKFTNGGQAVLRMRLATNEEWMANNEKKSATEWHTAVLWGKRAESLSKHLSKGSRIYVEGRLQTRSWEDNHGNKRNATEINVSEIKFCGDSQAQRQRRDDGYANHRGQQQDMTTPFDRPGDDGMGSIPF